MEIPDFEFMLKDHLGNVRAVVGENHSTPGNPDIKSYTNLYAFGAPHPKRNLNQLDQRFSFNGQEQPDEINGPGLHYSFKWREYDPVYGRWWGMDPIARAYPELTPYQFASNTPIQAFDLEGLEAVFVHGTWADPSTWDKRFVENMLVATGWKEIQEDAKEWEWSGDNTAKARMEAGKAMYEWLISEDNPYRELKHTTLIGHSHGGNVNKVAKNLLEEAGWKVDMINIATPQRSDFQSNSSGIGIYMNFYSPGDVVQWAGTLGNVADNGSRRDDKAHLNFRLIESSTPFNTISNLNTWWSDYGGHSLHTNPFVQHQIVDRVRTFFKPGQRQSSGGTKKSGAVYGATYK